MFLQLTSIATAEGTDWNAALGKYTSEPYRNRRALLSLRGSVDGSVPAFYLLALADAEMRAKRFDDARAHFIEALARGIDEPAASWARLGLAWASLAQDDVTNARMELERVAEGEGAAAPAGEFGAALLDAADRVPGAEQRLRSVSANPVAHESVRQAAALAVGYARYWSDDYDGARQVFEEFAQRPEAAELRDDARYAAAWARTHEGDRDGARVALEAMSRGGVRARRGTRALVNLEPQALLRAGIESYRRGPFRPPDQGLTQLIDVNGIALARAALGWMGPNDTSAASFAPPEPALAWSIRPAIASEGATRGVAVSASRRPPTRSAPSRLPEKTSGDTWRWGGVAAVAMLCLVLVRRWTRRRAHA